VVEFLSKQGRPRVLSGRCCRPKPERRPSEEDEGERACYRQAVDMVIQTQQAIHLDDYNGACGVGSIAPTRMIETHGARRDREPPWTATPAA